MKYPLLALISCAALVGCDINKPSQPSYKTESVTRGTVLNTIQATGTIEPEDLIDVGAQVTGQILVFGKDIDGKEVDYCSRVKSGQLLAEIDSVTYKADLRIAQANLSSAQAELTKANALLAQEKTKLNLADRDFTRSKKIGVGFALSQADYDDTEATYLKAVDAVKVADSSIAAAKAMIQQRQAAVEKAERNLSYCRIVAPVDGVIIDRRVNIGQTVVSSMSTSSLFLIAKDLTKIQIWVPVNEADICAIKPNQPVNFTIDAIANKTFKGEVGKVRLNATLSSNVVTYTVEVNTTNPDGTLLPYLTANVDFITESSVPDCLVIPVAATRWSPKDAQSQKAVKRGKIGKGAPGGKMGKGGKRATIYTLSASQTPQPVEVILGVSNGSSVEILAVKSGSLSADDAIITGEITQAQAKGGRPTGANPFMPKIPKRNKNVKGGPPVH